MPSGGFWNPDLVAALQMLLQLAVPLRRDGISVGARVLTLYTTPGGPVFDIGWREPRTRH
jgi:hypothetical protein